MAPAEVVEGTPFQCESNPTCRMLGTESEKQIGQLGTETLQAFGYELDAATDGFATRKTFRIGIHDLQIIDTKTLIVSGVELRKKLGSNDINLAVVKATP